MSEREETAPLRAPIRASNSSQKNSRSWSKNNFTSLASSLSNTVVRTCDVQSREQYDRCGGIHFSTRCCSPGSSLLGRYDDFKSQILKRRPCSITRSDANARLC